MIVLALLLASTSVDMSQAVVVRPNENAATTMFVEEVEKRTGIRLKESTSVPPDQPAIVVGVGREETRPEGYRLWLDESGRAPVVRVSGADARGTLFGVGALLRKLDWSKGRLSLEGPLDVKTAPSYPIRGHQIGYRTAANSWDAWSVAQFEQYIRDLALFGANSIENIPFQDTRPNPLMKVPRREMSKAMSAICRKYGLDYWVWTPADFDLRDETKRKAQLAQYEEFFADSVELTGVFVPGGDPGDNPPELLLPYMKEVARRMQGKHPKAKIWVSLQGFSKEQEEAAYVWIEKQKPEWLGGLVAGPSSPPVERTRQRLDKRYQLRMYPDLTHNKICQFQVPAWDQAYALTLGREAVNPRPAEFATVHNRWAGYSNGFISYSDGVHDDVNKNVWSALAWDPSMPVREVLKDYARVHFGSAVAEDAADGILALERNWRGSLADNGSVEGTLREWQRLEKRAPELESNWRWQMCLLRANYDAYVRHRLLNETNLEARANEIMAAAKNADQAMGAAMKELNRAVTEPVSSELRARIVALCDALFKSIGLQTSVEKYNASGEERGAVLDFVDYPLNNRWWLEDEFKKVRAMGSEKEKLARLLVLANWENPGPGSFYDDIGNVAKSLHVEGDAEQEDAFRGPEPTFWWWNEGKSRARLSQQTTMWPKRVVYEGLDPKATYVVRTGGYGKSLLKVNGQRMEGTQIGDFHEFKISPEQVRDQRLVLTWDKPTDEGHLNWRQHSRLAEVWLLKRD